MTPALCDFKVLTFDCYGTLIDWETGIWDALQPLIVTSGRRDVTRATALAAFGRHEHAQQTATPDMLYPKLLETVHRDLAAELGLGSTPELDAGFGDSIAHWPAFPDSADALRYLKSKFKLVVLSNVDRAGFAASSRKLGVEFDAVYTAQDIGSYKPCPANFEYMLAHLRDDFGFAPGEVLHTAQSMLHDHVQARAFGLANAWIDRQRLSQSGNWGATLPLDRLVRTDFRFFSMEEMAAAVRAESTPHS